jgi:hypothetical protein
MANSSVRISTPIGGLLGVAFVVLKLCKVIDWSWWWVTAPFWGPLVIILGIFAVVGTAMLVAMLFK